MKISEIQDITLQDINKMTDAELRKVTQAAAKAANQRISRLEKVEGGRYSPAYQQVDRTGGRIKTRGYSREQLKQEFKRAQGFLAPTTKTATVKGYKNFKARIADKVGVDDLTGAETKKLLDATAKLAELHPDIWTMYGVREKMAERVKKNPNVRISTLLKTGMAEIEKEYERQQSEFAEINDAFDDDVSFIDL